jgi:hypothetical protein
MFAQTLKPEVSALASMISPNLTLTVDKTVASPGETVTLSGSLDIPKEQGDIYKDNRIDLRDIAIAARAFGTVPGDPRWNPDADLNKDGKVDFRDIAPIARLYGQRSSGKPIDIYVSTDGATWTFLARVTTAEYPVGAFSYTDTIPSDAPTPSTRYYMAYFPGGVF